MSVLCSQLTFPAAVTQSKRINLPNCFLWPELSRTDNTRRQPSEEQILDWSLFTAQRRNVSPLTPTGSLFCFKILELSLLSECIIEEYYLQVKFINTNHKYFVDYLYLEELKMNDIFRFENLLQSAGLTVGVVTANVFIFWSQGTGYSKV